MIRKVTYISRITILFTIACMFLLMRSSGVKSGVPILIYHAIDNTAFGVEDIFVKTAQFYKQMQYLHEHGYATLTFDEIRNYYKYKKPVLITFDDGYEDVYKNAYPVLKKFNMKATMFLIAGQIGQPYYLTRKEIREMSKNFSFQSHTYHHSELDKMGSEQIEQECMKSKDIIEKITGKPVDTLSFPYGRYNRNVVRIAAKYYKYCVTTHYGIYNNTDTPYEINRIYVTHSENLYDFVQSLRFAT